MHSVRKGDRISVKGSVIALTSSSDFDVWFDGDSTVTRVNRLTQLEVIERPWRVGDRFKCNWLRTEATIRAASPDGQYYWVEHTDGSYDNWERDELTAEDVELLP